MTWLLDAAGELVRPLFPEGSRRGDVVRRVAHHERLRGPVTPQPVWRVVEEFGRAFPEATFVQVGSNDGSQRDPLREQIVQRGWNGIMVEPVPYVFERLKENYGHIGRVRLEMVAVGDHVGTQDLWHLRKSDDPTLPQWYDALGSFRKDVLLKHVEFIPDIEERLVATEVPVVTFEVLCERNGLDRIDLVQIDTEGYDFEVIKLIDLDRWKPALLMYECLHLEPDSQAACSALLARHGYEELSDGMDTVCLRVGELGSRRYARLRRVWRDARMRQ
jgi:FkbM family methyltransferase